MGADYFNHILSNFTDTHDEGLKHSPALTIRIGEFIINAELGPSEVRTIMLDFSELPRLTAEVNDVPTMTVGEYFKEIPDGAPEYHKEAVDRLAGVKIADILRISVGEEVEDLTFSDFEILAELDRTPINHIDMLNTFSLALEREQSR